MADAGEIKAKVTIEYDGSGVDAAKSDLEKLAEMAGGLGDGGIGDAISQMGNSFAEGTKGAEDFANAVEGVEEPLKSGEEAVSSFNDALEEHTQTLGDHQQAIESLGSAYEELPEPVSRAQESIVAMNDSFAQSGRSIGETMASYQAFTEQFNNGSSTFTPETLWNADDAAAMKDSLVATNQSFAGIIPTAQDADKAVAEFFGNTNNAAEKTGGIFGDIFGEGGALGKVGEGFGGFFGSIGDAVGGLMTGLNQIAMPLMAVQMLGQMAQSAGSWLYNQNLAAEGPNASNPASFTSQVNQLGANAAQGGNQFAVGFGAGLNPSLNAWNNEAQSGGGGSDFWSGLGKFSGGVVGGGVDILQVLGGSLLAGLSFGNAGMMQTGTNWENSGMQGLVNMYDAANGIPLQYPGTAGPYGGYTPSGRFQQMALSDWSSQPGGMTSAQANVAADWQYFQNMPTGAPGPGYTAGGQAPGTMYGGTIQNPTQPEGLQALTDPSAWSDIGKSIGQGFQNSPIGQIWSQASATQMQSGQSGVEGLNFGSIGQGLQSAGKFLWDITGGGIGNDLSQIGSYFGIGGGQQQATPYGPVGCFPAGTPVLLANGCEKPIEALQIGEKVLAHDGVDEVITTVLAHITPPARVVYKLTFTNGITLTTTDSHPIATPLQGWKALSPQAARRENPDLPVSLLKEGDEVLTFYGAITLISIEKQNIEQIYNITVGEPHTFYASGVLVHNKGEAMTSAGTGTETISLSHTFVANVTWAANNLEKQVTAVAQWAEQGVQHAVTAVANWAEQNVIHPVVAAAQWTEQNVIKPVVAAAQWTEQNLQHMATAVAQWAEENLQHAATAIAQWTEQNVLHPVVAAAQWAEKNLEHTATAVASWGEKNLEHLFEGIASWTAQGLEHTFFATASWVMGGGGVPGFAEGTSNAPGGVAMIAEAGSPEVVEYGGRYSLFDRPSFVNLPQGAAVYPMQDLVSSSPRMLAAGTVGDTTPVSFMLGGGASGAHTANINVYIDSQILIQALGMSLMSTINVGLGKRSF